MVVVARLLLRAALIGAGGVDDDRLPRVLVVDRVVDAADGARGAGADASFGPWRAVSGTPTGDVPARLSLPGGVDADRLGGDVGFVGSSIGDELHEVGAETEAPLKAPSPMKLAAGYKAWALSGTGGGGGMGRAKAAAALATATALVSGLDRDSDRDRTTSHALFSSVGSSPMKLSNGYWHRRRRSGSGSDSRVGSGGGAGRSWPSCKRSREWPWLCRSWWLLARCRLGLPPSCPALLSRRWLGRSRVLMVRLSRPFLPGTGWFWIVLLGLGASWTGRRLPAVVALLRALLRLLLGLRPLLGSRLAGGCCLAARLGRRRSGPEELKESLAELESGLAR